MRIGGYLQTSSSLWYCWTSRNDEYCSGLRTPALLTSTRLNTSSIQYSKNDVGFPETCKVCHCAGAPVTTFVFCCEIYCPGGSPETEACCELYCVGGGPGFATCCGVYCAGIGCGAGMGTGGYVFWEKFVMGAGCAEALMLEFVVGYIAGYVDGYGAG